jgi:hypothetical protein
MKTVMTLPFTGLFPLKQEASFYKGYAEQVYLMQSVSAYADVIKDPKGSGRLVFNWPPDLVLYYQNKLMQRFILHAAWQEIPVSAVVELLDSVRNRTLNMALQLKDELGTSFSDLTRIKPEDRRGSKVSSSTISAAT